MDTETAEDVSEAPPVWGFEACDSCGHRSQWIAYKGDKLLTFCGHHAQKNVGELRLDGWEITEIE